MNMEENWLVLVVHRLTWTFLFRSKYMGVAKKRTIMLVYGSVCIMTTILAFKFSVIDLALGT